VNAADEHLATRRRAGVFDFSFMNGWEIAGRDALRLLDRLQTRNLRLVPLGRIGYTLLCRDDGSVFIDATVWSLGEGRYWLFTGRRSDAMWLTEVAAPFDVQLTQLLPKLAIIGVQGPSSCALLERLSPGCAAGLAYFGFHRCRIGRFDCTIGRLGYTGEIGYELLLPTSDAPALWTAIVDAGRDCGAAECSWEAANSLRIEAGYVHFDYELAGIVYPHELGLGRLVDFSCSEWIGRDALRAVCREPLRRRLSGFTFEAGARASSPSPAQRAQVTSEAYSPLFDRRLALAFVDAEVSAGSVAYAQDGRRGRIARLPFFDPPRAVPRRAPLAR
jgi:glycine cleavage system aminomethyltransferase T